MGAEVFALLAAMGWAADGILVRKGSRYSDVSSAVLLGFLATCGLLWTFNLWYFPLHLLYSPAVIYFVLSGLIQPALVRMIHYTGIVRLGVSRAGPLRGVTPLIALVFAIIFLNEQPSLLVYVAVVLTVAGVGLISYRREGEKEWKTFDLSFPLGAALLGAISQIIRKTGLLILPNPFLAAAITTTTSLFLFPFVLLATGKTRSIQFNRACMPFYGSAALIATVSQLFTFTALSKGDISVVVTIVNTHPLFTLVFSAIFLRDTERVTPMVVIGVLMLVTGIALIANR